VVFVDNAFTDFFVEYFADMYKNFSRKGVLYERVFYVKNYIGGFFTNFFKVVPQLMYKLRNISPKSINNRFYSFLYVYSFPKCRNYG
jgi:hypothetical protein